MSQNSKPHNSFFSSAKDTHDFRQGTMYLLAEGTWRNFSHGRSPGFEERVLRMTSSMDHATNQPSWANLIFFAFGVSFYSRAKRNSPKPEPALGHAELPGF